MELTQQKQKAKSELGKQLKRAQSKLTKTEVRRTQGSVMVGRSNLQLFRGPVRN